MGKTVEVPAAVLAALVFASAITTAGSSYVLYNLLNSDPLASVEEQKPTEVDVSFADACDAYQREKATFNSAPQYPSDAFQTK